MRISSHRPILLYLLSSSRLESLITSHKPLSTQAQQGSRALLSTLQSSSSPLHLHLHLCWGHFPSLVLWPCHMTLLNISTFCPLTSPVPPFSRPALLILTFKPPFLTCSPIIMSSLTGILVNVYSLYIRVKFPPWSLLQVCRLNLLIRIYNLIGSCTQKHPSSERVLMCKVPSTDWRGQGCCPLWSVTGLSWGDTSQALTPYTGPLFPHAERLASVISLAISKLMSSPRQWI